MEPPQWSRSAILIILDESARDRDAALLLSLQKYFEDKGRSGGGKLQAAVGFINPYNAVVCFGDPETKERVLKTQNHRIQREDGRELQLFVTECPLQLKHKMAITPATQIPTSALPHERSTLDFATTTTTPELSDEDDQPPHTAAVAPPAKEEEEGEEEAGEEEEEGPKEEVGEEGEEGGKGETGQEEEEAGGEEEEEEGTNDDHKKDKEERTVVVEGLDSDVTPDVLDKVFIDAAGSGDPVETISIDGSSEMAVVVLSSKEDVDTVLKELADRPVKISGRTLKVTGCRSLALSSSEPDPAPEVLHDPRTIFVSGVEPNLPQKYLELFFKNKKKSGGGPIESIDTDSSCDFCRITFKNQEDAAEVISKGPHRLGNCDLKVCSSAGFNPGLKEPDVATDRLDGRTECNGDSSLFAAEADTTEGHGAALPVVEVQGLTRGVGEDWLKFFFSDKNLSGGGEIKEFHYDEGTDHAFLTFEDEEVAERVLTQQTLEVGNSFLSLRRASPNVQQSTNDISEDRDLEVRERTVKVLGVDKKFYDLKTVKGLFETEGTTGGGPIHDISYEGKTGTIVICFENAAVAQRVLQKDKIFMGEQVLTVEPFQQSMFDESHGQ